MAKYAFIFAFLSHTYMVQGRENVCEVYTFENCIQEVRCKIEEKSVEKRRSFTLSLVSSTGQEETVAEMSYVGFYKCEAARNYTCDRENDTIFSIILPCTARGELTFSDDEQAIPCMHAQRQRSSSESNQNIYKKNDTDFQNDTNTISEENMLKTAIAVSFSLIVMVIISVICYIKRKVILKAICEKQIKKVKKDRDDAELALNSKTTANQTKAQDEPLLEKV